MVRALVARALLLVLGLALLVPALWHVATLAQIFAARIGYPMDIEWMEGGALLHTHRLLAGEAVYGPPSQGFLPYPYPPVHFTAVGLAATFAGLDYATGRAVSIAAFALACAVFFVEAMRASGRRRGFGVALGLTAVAAAAASFPVVGGWYDVVRNDSLAIALPLLGAALVSGDNPSRKQLIASAAVFTAALFTKQTGVFFAAWVGLFLLVRRFPRAIVFGLSMAVLSGALLAGLQIATQGRFWLYTVKNLARHQVRGSQALDGLRILFEFAPFLALLPLLAILARRRRWLRPRTALWIGMLVAAFPAAILPFAKAGGFLNNLIPVALLAGPVFALLVGDVLQGLWSSPRARAAAEIAALALAAAFFVHHRYDKARYIPSEDLWTRAVELNKFVASLEGGVLIPSHPFLAVRNGHTTPQFHDMPYWDAMVGRMRGIDLPGFLKRTRAKWVILSGLEGPTIRGWIHQLYKPHKQLPKRARVNPLTGYPSAPRHLLRLREPVNKRERRVLFDFEAGLDGWTTSGDAFTPGVVGASRHKLLTSFAPKLYDEAVGEAISPAFVVDRDRLGFLIGGGKSSTTRVELRVDGKKVLSEVGIESDILTEVTWDMRKFRGKTAQLAVIDQEKKGWGHIAIDEVELFDEAAPAR